jgi:uncharacterized membrane protein
MSKNFFNQQEQDAIIRAIQQAEKETSGEIRVHIEPDCKEDPYVRAKEVFEKLEMHATELKNGVLFYVAYNDKKFAVLGDKGIHEKVQQHFWNEVKDLMETQFKQGEFCKGLCMGIEKAGEKLNTYFPYQHNDKDELSNDISFGGETE